MFVISQMICTIGIRCISNIRQYIIYIERASGFCYCFAFPYASNTNGVSLSIQYVCLLWCPLFLLHFKRNGWDVQNLKERNIFHSSFELFGILEKVEGGLGNYSTEGSRLLSSSTHPFERKYFLFSLLFSSFYNGKVYTYASFTQHSAAASPQPKALSK